MSWSISKLFSKPKVLVVDQSLVDEAGHHLNVASALARTFDDAGFSSRTLTHSDFAPRDYPVLRAKPVFLNRTYDAVFSVMERPSRYEALEHKISIELEHALSDCKETTVVFPTLTFTDMPAVADWISAHPQSERLQVFFWLVFGPEFLVRSDSQIELARDWYRDGFEQLEQAARTGARICPIVETPGLHAVWQDLTDLSIETVRLPSMVHFLAERDRPSSKRQLTVGYGGDVRSGKGFELLPETVTTALAKRPNLRFDIRVAIENPDQHEREIQALQNAGPGVSLEIGTLPPTRFQEFLAGCDLILLPYDPEIYVLRGSSICDEAEALGIPQIVPRNVSFSHKAIAAGAARAFGDYTAESVSAALLAAIDDIDRLRESSSALRKHVTNQNQQFLALMQRG